MTAPRMDNGEWMMRAERDADPYRRLAQQLAREAAQQILDAYLTPRAWSNPQPEPEDTTGLKMLDEFLAKRRRARDD
jgi:hypothetical protein